MWNSRISSYGFRCKKTLRKNSTVLSMFCDMGPLKGGRSGGDPIPQHWGTDESGRVNVF